MKSLDQPIGLGMVGSRHLAFDAPGLGELGEEGRGELGTSVCGYCRWYTEVLNPSICEGVYDAFGRDVDYGDRNRPS